MPQSKLYIGLDSPSEYRIAQNFDWGNFDVFDAFQLDHQNLSYQNNCLIKTIQRLQVYGERQ